METHPGGTRWNPTQEQIGILELLYKGGMRTPNAQQIEHITAQLGKYGKIEGKNVFYWFQNHKARERQKQKRNSLGLSHCPKNSAPITTITLDNRVHPKTFDLLRLVFHFFPLYKHEAYQIYHSFFYRWKSWKERRIVHIRGSAGAGYSSTWKMKADRHVTRRKTEL